LKKLLRKLEERKNEGNYRYLKVSEGLSDFFSNDYLGLAKNEELADLIHKEHRKLKGNINGATGSRLLSGNSDYFLETEKELARLFCAESALIFNSGYSANLSLLSSVPQKGDTIIYDELIHASLKEGAHLSFAKRYSFRHNDISDLEKKMSLAEGDVYVIAESVYSMDGDFSPLKKLVELCTEKGAYLILDEAHSTGIWGDRGNGIACELGLHDKIFARVYTFGKAMGIHGACVAGSESLIKYLINFSRPFIYTTALPPHSVAAIQVGFDYLGRSGKLADILFSKISFFKNCFGNKREPYGLEESESAIQVLKISGNRNAKQMEEMLIQKGFDVRAILSPTVKEGEERLRICLHVYNSDEEIRQLVDAIKDFKLK
jgi:8-amino-7-oxononanoate synthase